MPAKARCQITVRHYECDPLGHVNHAMYVHYFEVGRLTAMADAGLPFGAILKQGYTVVAVDIYVQYKAPAFTDDVLEIESYITDFHGALMTWQQAIQRRTDGVLVRSGRSEWRLYTSRWTSHTHPAINADVARNRLCA